MGLLSIYFKPNFLGLLKCLNNLNWFIVFFSLINLSVCIYEDQIGKFDWRQTYVGRIKYSQFDTVSTAKKIIVATEENVLAALNLKTGQVVWRHVFESASAGNIQLLHVSDKVVTVTGSNPYLVRGWDSSTGVLIWEWSLTLQNDDQADFSEWWVQNNMLVHMLPMFGSHIEVSMYHLMTGQNRGATAKLPASWTNDGCVLTPPYYTCVSGEMKSQQLLSLDVTSNAVQLISRPLAEFVDLNSYDGSLRPVDGNSGLPAFIVDDKRIVMIKHNEFEVLKTAVFDPTGSVTLLDIANGPVVLQAWLDDTQGFSIQANSVSGAELPELRMADRDLKLPDPEISSAVCTKSAREQLVCRILVTGGDDSVHLMQQGGRVLWSREEALANVVAVEFVELPVSDLDAAIESEFDQKEAAKMYSSIWAAFSRRLQTQFQQLQTLVNSVQGEGAAQHQPLALVRDYFGLHKLIVLVTDVGKIFGMDNLSGAILWQYYEPSLDTEGAVVFTRRTARHPPHDAYITIVGKHEETGNGLIISLNPITGTLIGERLLKLDVQLLQCTILHRPDNEKLHALILLDKDENVQVFPQSAAPLVENMFMYVADRSTARVQGYAIVYNGQSAIAVRTWLVRLGGGSQRIVLVQGKSATERVHSPGRVLPDRAVLYKYLNPNLVLVLTEGPDPLHKDVVVATCLDAASGAIVASQIHRRARALPLAVHSENYLAYLYYNDKHRRTEIATMELYEGKQRWTQAGAAFSSLATERAPGVERQAFIVPAAPAAAALTATERSLTDKHVLLALTSGAIVEVPWIYLEARRGGISEEGVVLPAYAPELPLPGDARLNYNLTVARPERIYAAPSGLESTSLVLTTGLDLFYTRVAPSKTFDVLKDDFDYYLITIVLAGLILATYSTKYFASRKMLKLAWK
nr:ER membrane protein complex subunit 1 isoform X1 [Helicoverpa armigera]